MGRYGRFLVGEPPGSAKDADRIRQFVLEHYIEPGRKDGLSEDDILVRDVNSELVLKEAWPNICQSLAGPIFQEMAPSNRQNGLGPIGKPDLACRHAIAKSKLAAVRLTFPINSSMGREASLPPVDTLESELFT